MASKKEYRRERVVNYYLSQKISRINTVNHFTAEGYPENTIRNIRKYLIRKQLKVWQRSNTPDYDP